MKLKKKNSQKKFSKIPLLNLPALFFCFFCCQVTKIRLEKKPLITHMIPFEKEQKNIMKKYCKSMMNP
jgi:hypothetical protein